MWTVTLRQEITDCYGFQVKVFHAKEYSVGKPDVQMYYFKSADGNTMLVNRNNILSIVSTQNTTDVSFKAA